AEAARYALAKQWMVVDNGNADGVGHHVELSSGANAFQSTGQLRLTKCWRGPAHEIGPPDPNAIEEILHFIAELAGATAVK
ncbi:hypothetical protein ACWGTI_32355, partial [Mesorhizobium sp. ArgA1]